MKIPPITPEFVKGMGTCWSTNQIKEAFGEHKSRTWRQVMSEKSIAFEDRIWFANSLTSARNRRLFACDCADRALARIENPDPRHIEVVRVARAYALGEAAIEDLDAAHAAAEAAASANAIPAVYAAAYAANAAAHAARAVYAAAYAAAYAAYAADAPAERQWQLTRAMEYLEEQDK